MCAHAQKICRDGVEYRFHHAADVDDLAFMVAVASIFAASYAASPRHGLFEPTSASSAAQTTEGVRGYHFFLLHMLAWQSLSPLGLFVVAAVLHGISKGLHKIMRSRKTKI